MTVLHESEGGTAGIEMRCLSININETNFLHQNYWQCHKDV